MTTTVRKSSWAPPFEAISLLQEAGGQLRLYGSESKQPTHHGRFPSRTAPGVLAPGYCGGLNTSWAMPAAVTDAGHPE